MSEKKINAENVKALAELREFLNVENSLIVVDYRGLTVSEITNLRLKMADKGGDLKVVKNKIARIALKEHGLDEEKVNKLLSGPTAIASAEGEANKIARILYDVAKEEESPLVLKGAIIEKELLDSEALNEFALLPTKEEALALFIAVLQAPMSKLARTLQALADKK